MDTGDSVKPKAIGSKTISVKLRAKLNRAIEEQNFYEAHQIYRTIYYRSQSKDRLIEVLDLLQEGALMLLRNKQWESGADLSMLFLDALEMHVGTIPEENLATVAEFHKYMPRGSPERQKYVLKAVKLSANNLANSYGNPDLHSRIAKNLWDEKDYLGSRHHYLRSHNGQSCGLMLVEFHVVRGYVGEVDLFITQTVFQYLCLMKDCEAANVTLSVYCRNHPSLRNHGGPPYNLPLLNFVWLLLLTIQSRTLTWFSILCNKYKPVLSRDPSYLDYLDRIGQIFFGIKPPPQNRSLFGNLFNSLFSGLDDSDDSDAEPSAPGPSSSASARPALSAGAPADINIEDVE